MVAARSPVDGGERARGQRRGRLPRLACLLAAALAAPVAAQDTITVRADGPPRWGASLRLVEELRIGALEGADEYQFGRVGAVAVRRDGGILVYDAQIPLIRHYDARGRYVRAIGRGGQGPGEYRQVLGMHTLPGDRLAAWDVGNARITVYDSSGAYAESHPVSLASAVVGGGVFAVDTAGRYYVTTLDTRAVPALRPELNRDTELPELAVRILPSGTVLDSLALPMINRSPGSFVLATAAGYRWNFPDGTERALSVHGYLVTGHSRTYAIHLLLPGGPVRKIVRDVPSVGLTRGERTQWQAWARYFEKLGERDGRAHRFRDPPRTKPVFRSLWVDADGRIWVGRYVAAERVTAKPRESGDERPVYQWREPATFDVIEPDGTFLGTVVLPPDSYPSGARGQLIWAVRRGEMDEQYVLRLRVIPGS